MSKAKHRGYRQVLNIEHTTCKTGTLDVPITLVTWCMAEGTTSRTIKSTHVAVTAYVGGLSFRGTSARMPSKAVSINLKQPLKSKCFELWGYSGMVKQACYNAWVKYLPSLGVVSGTVLWFDERRGEGEIRCDVTDVSVFVYACNIPGAKTGFSETACMVLQRDEQVTFTHHEACGAQIVTGGTFDADKWANLDQSRLAFKKDESGAYINGLFAYQEEV